MHIYSRILIKDRRVNFLEYNKPFKYEIYYDFIRRLHEWLIIML